VDYENHLIFGRVVTDKTVRNQGAGKKLLEELINYCDIHYPGINLKCSAQNYLTRFYGQFGFKTLGSIYDEDGIPHIEMRRKSPEKVTVSS
jgi:ElaA protein